MAKLLSLQKGQPGERKAEEQPGSSNLLAQPIVYIFQYFPQKKLLAWFSRLKKKKKKVDIALGLFCNSQ